MPQFDSLRELVLLDVPGGHGQRGLGDVRRDDLGVRDILGDGDRDHAAAGAQIADLLRAGALPQELDRPLHEQLGLRPRDQAVGRDLEFNGVELRPADEIGDRLVLAGPLDQVAQLRQLLLTDDLVVLRVKLDPLEPQDVGQQQFGTEPRRVHAFLRQVFRHPRQQLLNRPFIHPCRLATRKPSSLTTRMAKSYLLISNAISRSSR